MVNVLYILHSTLINAYDFMLVNKKFFSCDQNKADFRGSTGFIVFKKTSSLSYAKLGSITLISKEDKDKFERVNIMRRLLYM